MVYIYIKHELNKRLHDKTKKKILANTSATPQPPSGHTVVSILISYVASSSSYCIHELGCPRHPPAHPVG